MQQLTSMFDLQPTLIGKLLSLRPLRRADYGALRLVAADPLIWEQHPDKTRSTPDGFQKFFDDAMTSGGALIAMHTETQAVIGSSRYYGFDKDKSEVEVGWTFLARKYWGGVYNGEMKTLMLTHAYRFVNTVIFKVGPQNLRSQKAVEKIGGVRGGTVVDAATGREGVVFALTAARFREWRPPPRNA